QIKDRFLNSTSTDYNLLSKIIKQLESLIYASNQHPQKHSYLVVEFTQRENPNYTSNSINPFNTKYILTVKCRKSYALIKEKSYRRDFEIEFLMPAILSDLGKEGWEVIESCKERNKWLFVMKRTCSFTKEMLDYKRNFPGEDDEVDLLPDD
ncbi:MAG: hypothetical protein ACRCU2_06080, partial [Planktothrix sp.]